MTAQLRHWWHDLWEHMPAAITELPVLTAGEQTKLTWAKPVATLAEAPPFYAEYLEDLAAALGGFPQCILTPSYAGFLTRTTEKLICCYDDRLHIFERAGDELRTVIYTHDGIDRMEFGSILLKAWLTIVGTDSEGRHVATTTKFNTVTDYLFTPILTHWRSRGQRHGEASLTGEQAKFNYLVKDYYKFMNIARRQVLPGDSVLAAVMQPELRAPFATLFGRTYTRFRAPAHLVLLTDRELIVAAEEDRAWWESAPRYGSISTYIPLCKLAGVTATPLPDGGCRWTLHLPGDEQIQLDFAPAQATDAERLLALLAQRAPHITYATT